MTAALVDVSIFRGIKNPLQRVVLIELAGFAIRGRAWPSESTLAECVGCCVKTVRKAIRALEALGELRVWRRQKRRNIYYLKRISAPEAPRRADQRLTVPVSQKSGEAGAASRAPDRLPDRAAPIAAPARGSRGIGAQAEPTPSPPRHTEKTVLPDGWLPPDEDIDYSATGFPRRYFADGGEVLYLKDRSDDGILGRSRLSRAPGAVACGIGAQGFSEGIWTNGAIVNGVLTHPGRIGTETMNAIAQSWRDQHAGAGNAGKVSVLEEGMKYEKIGVSPEDAELLDSRKFSVVELCRLFNVPPAVVGDFAESNFATSDAAMRFFATGCLAQWCAKVQAEFSRSVFNTPDAVLHLDLEGLLRGDYTAHATALINLVRSGVISQDEARHELGYNPRGGAADELRPQAVGGRPEGADEGQGATSDPGGSLSNGLSNGAAVH